MATSCLLACTIWAPVGAGPVDHYRPERPRMAQAAPERRASVIRLVYLPPAGARQRARANHLTNTVGSIMGAIGEDRLIYRFELDHHRDRFWSHFVIDFM